MSKYGDAEIAAMIRHAQGMRKKPFKRDTPEPDRPQPAAADATKVSRTRGHTGIASVIRKGLDDTFGEGASRRRRAFEEGGGPAGQVKRLANRFRRH